MSKKLIITLSICLAFTLSSNAQNQLTFNQVLLVTLTSQGDTVPQGKVWKVESAVSEIAKNDNSTTYFHVNGFISDVTKIAKATYGQSNIQMGWAWAYAIENSNLFPMWLPAGTIVTSGLDVSALSIIEFNIE